jgi:hypothetical protein
MLDSGGAKLPVVLGCVLGAVGFALWAQRATNLNLGSQVWFIVLAGAGMGFMLSPASTDAVNRASSLSYGEATGITQTVRNYAASLGLAVLGTISVTRFTSQLTSSLVGQGLSPGRASQEAATLSQGHASTSTATIPHYVRLDFAYSIQTVLYVMAGIMAVAAIVGLIGLRFGVQEEGVEAAERAGTPEAADNGELSAKPALSEGGS